MIYNVPGKKGVYSTFEMTEQDAKKTFGVDGDPDETGPSTPTTEPAASTEPAPAPRRPTMGSKYATSVSAGAINRRIQTELS
jgi:hypothetical protein